MGKSLSEFVYPTRCVGCGKLGNWFCEGCTKKITYIEHQICPKCKRRVMQGFTHPACLTRYSPDRLVSIFLYKDHIKEAIKQLKYKTEVLRLAKVLGDLASDYLEKYQIYIPSDFVFVPIPLSGVKHLERTYNQAALIAKALSGEIGHKMEGTILVRVRETKSQTESTLKERQENVKNAFIVFDKAKDKVKGKNIVLVDDVWTTGATALAASQALKKAGAKMVWILTVARGGSFISKQD